MNIADFISELQSCRACSFGNDEIAPIAPVASSTPVRIMFIGENPSWAENQDSPFSNTTISGRALREYYLEPHHLSDSDVWITDLFKCRYPKDVYHAKQANNALIQDVALKCANLWLTRELALAQPHIVVTLSDKEGYQRLRKAFGWKSPAKFADAVGQSHAVNIGSFSFRVFPMIHPDISRPAGDGDSRKMKSREKWAPLHHELHIPALREELMLRG